MNSWQSYATVDSHGDDGGNTREAAAVLQACLTEFPDHYIRLIGIDRQTNRRINETIVQRP